MTYCVLLAMIAMYGHLAWSCSELRDPEHDLDPNLIAAFAWRICIGLLSVLPVALPSLLCMRSHPCHTNLIRESC